MSDIKCYKKIIIGPGTNFCICFADFLSRKLSEKRLANNNFILKSPSLNEIITNYKEKIDQICTDGCIELRCVIYSKEILDFMKSSISHGIFHNYSSMVKFAIIHYILEISKNRNPNDLILEDIRNYRGSGGALLSLPITLPKLNIHLPLIKQTSNVGRKKKIYSEKNNFPNELCAISIKYLMQNRVFCFLLKDFYRKKRINPVRKFIAPIEGSNTILKPREMLNFGALEYISSLFVRKLSNLQSLNNLSQLYKFPIENDVLLSSLKIFYERLDFIFK